MFDLNLWLSFSLVNAVVLGGLQIGVIYSSRANSRSRKLLTAIILVSLWNEFITVLISNGMASEYPLLVRSTFPTRGLVVILFYFYVRSLIEIDFKLKNQSRIHLLPVGIGLLWFALPWLGGYPELLTPGRHFDFEHYLFSIFRFALALPYVVAMIRVIRRYEIQVKAEHSTASDFRLLWLRCLTLLFMTTTVIQFVDVVTGPNIQIWIYNPLIVAGTLCIFTFIALRSSRLTSLETPPTASQVMSDSDLLNLKDKLLRLLKDSKVYQNPQVRLKDVADLLNTKSYRLTEVINRACQSNFNDLINSLRVECAKDLLLSATHAHQSILSIAFDSGFSSKSAFNEVFKRNVGMTPSRFRLRGAPGSANTTVRTSALDRPDA